MNMAARVTQRLRGRATQVVLLILALVACGSCDVGTPTLPPPPKSEQKPILPFELRSNTPQLIGSARSVDLCDLVSAPSGYEGQIVRVTGILLVGLEHIDLTAERCYYQAPICAQFHRVEEFTPSNVTKRFNELAVALGRKVTVVGEFHSAE